MYGISLQLSLYLNAGLVLSAALSEMAADYESAGTPGARLLSFALRESESKNMPFETVLFDAAKIIQNKELLKFAVLLNDNRSKGTELCDKLERDRNQMQSGRLSLARARAKKAETKLCFPLALLLIVLVAVCLAPAVFNM